MTTTDTPTGLSPERIRVEMEAEHGPAKRKPRWRNEGRELYQGDKFRGMRPTVAAAERFVREMNRGK